MKKTLLAALAAFLLAGCVATTPKTCTDAEQADGCERNSEAGPKADRPAPARPSPPSEKPGGPGKVPDKPAPPAKPAKPGGGHPGPKGKP